MIPPLTPQAQAQTLATRTNLKMITVPQLRKAFDDMVAVCLPTLNGTTAADVNQNLKLGYRYVALGQIASAIAARYTMHVAAVRAYADFWAMLAKSGISISAL